jgi:PHP family Zn ribbon phosphoesterase
MTAEEIYNSIKETDKEMVEKTVKILYNKIYCVNPKIRWFNSHDVIDALYSERVHFELKDSEKLIEFINTMLLSTTMYKQIKANPEGYEDLILDHIELESAADMSMAILGSVASFVEVKSDKTNYDTICLVAKHMSSVNESVGAFCFNIQ